MDARGSGIQISRDVLNRDASPARIAAFQKVVHAEAAWNAVVIFVLKGNVLDLVELKTTSTL